eukprot:Nitzschia sp. Nitz4//scaffold6_size259037//191400//192620//NITZ4_001102-RA/size259037-augustus-gene-0.300-mRNA-1//1//CDS//3329556977//6358//frame0
MKIGSSSSSLLRLLLVVSGLVSANAFLATPIPVMQRMGNGMMSQPLPTTATLTPSKQVISIHDAMTNLAVQPLNAAASTVSDTTDLEFVSKPRQLLSQAQKAILNMSFQMVKAIVCTCLVIGYMRGQQLLAAEDVVVAAATEHLHIGQKIANSFMRFGLPKWAVLATISAMPVVELRGAVPVGIWMGLPIMQVLPICVLGNMAPIVPMLFLLRNPSLKKLMAPILSRAEKKTAGLGVGLREQWISLALFVGIPLPGTGAWTGAMGAFLLGMPTGLALSSIFAGVVSAGLIMSAITVSGKKGGMAAIAIFSALMAKELMGKSKTSPADTTTTPVETKEE